MAWFDESKETEDTMTEETSTEEERNSTIEWVSIDEIDFSGKYQVMPSMDDEEYAGLKLSIEEEGIDEGDAIVIDEDGNALDGHHTAEACEDVGLEDVPVIRKTGMSEAEKKDFAFRRNMARRHLDGGSKGEVVKRYLLEDHVPEDTPQTEIAEFLSVDQSTVSRAKSELADEEGVEKYADAYLSTGEKKEMAFGILHNDPEIPITKLADESGLSRPTARKVRDRMESDIEDIKEYFGKNPEAIPTEVTIELDIESGSYAIQVAREEMEKEAIQDFIDGDNDITHWQSDIRQHLESDGVVRPYIKPNYSYLRKVLKELGYSNPTDIESEPEPETDDEPDEWLEDMPADDEPTEHPVESTESTGDGTESASEVEQVVSPSEDTEDDRERESGEDEPSVTVENRVEVTESEREEIVDDLVPKMRDEDAELVREKLKEMERRREALREHPGYQEAQESWDNTFAFLGMMMYEHVVTCPECGSGMDSLIWECCDLPMKEAGELVHEYHQEKLDSLDNIEDEIEYRKMGETA